MSPGFAPTLAHIALSIRDLVLLGWFVWPVGAITRASGALKVDRSRNGGRRMVDVRSIRFGARPRGRRMSSRGGPAEALAHDWSGDLIVKIIKVVIVGFFIGLIKGLVVHRQRTLGSGEGSSKRLASRGQHGCRARWWRHHLSVSLSLQRFPAKLRRGRWRSPTAVGHGSRRGRASWPVHVLDHRARPTLRWRRPRPHRLRVDRVTIQWRRTWGWTLVVCGIVS